MTLISVLEDLFLDLNLRRTGLGGRRKKLNSKSEEVAKPLSFKEPITEVGSLLPGGFKRSTELFMV